LYYENYRYWGGELKYGETFKIDKEIVNLTKKKLPKALFIPTASGDSEKYFDIFKQIYGKKLGCKVEVLYLIKDKLSKNDINEKILSSDLIYIGGGNTNKLLDVWKKKEIDKILKKAGNKGIILSGLSAGAYCWSNKSLSSSKEQIYNGLEFIKLNFVCHYSKKNKEIVFKNLKKLKKPIVALENNSAIEIIGDKYRILTSSKNAKAYKLYLDNDNILEKKLQVDNKFRKVKSLL